MNKITLLASIIASHIAVAAALAAPAPAQPTPLKPPPGIWESSGYGWVLQIDANGAQRQYHRAGEMCVANDPNAPSHELALDSLYLVRRDADGKGFTGFIRDNITRLHFSQLDALPAACVKPAVTSDPVANFEYVWQTFNEHYAFFSGRGVDWYRTYEQFRPQVNPKTTPQELAAVLTAMFETLDDRHVTLNRPGFEEYRSGLGPIVNAVKRDYDAQPAKQKTGFYEFLDARLAVQKAMIKDRYLGASFQTAGNDQISWGKIGDVGYLRIDSESSYANSGGYAAEAAVLTAALDKAFASFADTRAVILDLRFNLGGNDKHGLAIASRFTARPYTAYIKYARNKAGYTAPQPLRVEAAKSTYTGAVYALTSNVTVSAGENLLLALMGRPGVVRVGETTASAFSDQLAKTMPNGWTFSVSNEVFEAIDGKVYETKGIPPNVTIKNSVLIQPAKTDIVIDYVLAQKR
jgi:carboxyl-terminal processing protease